MRLGDKSSVNCECIPTGALALDIALGIGGVPRGRIIEIYGPESSGKTTLCLHVIANAQKAGGTAAFIDAEHAVDPVYARKIGVNIDNLLISQPDCGEDALNIAEMLVRGAIPNSWSGYARGIKRKDGTELNIKFDNGTSTISCDEVEEFDNSEKKWTVEAERLKEQNYKNSVAEINRRAYESVNRRKEVLEGVGIVDRTTGEVITSQTVTSDGERNLVSFQ